MNRATIIAAALALPLAVSAAEPAGYSDPRVPEWACGAWAWSRYNQRHVCIAPSDAAMALRMAARAQAWEQRQQPRDRR